MRIVRVAAACAVALLLPAVVWAQATVAGVSGTFTDTRGTMSGTALVGKASLIFGATLHKLADIN